LFIRFVSLFRFQVDGGGFARETLERFRRGLCEVYGAAAQTRSLSPASHAYSETAPSMKKPRNRLRREDLREACLVPRTWTGHVVRAAVKVSARDPSVLSAGEPIGALRQSEPISQSARSRVQHLAMLSCTHTRESLAMSVIMFIRIDTLIATVSFARCLEYRSLARKRQLPI